jgi:hypothetical protein
MDEEVFMREVKAMNIQIWDTKRTASRYTVCIDNHVFWMGIYPDRANDLNMYAGEKQLSSNKGFDRMMKQNGAMKLTKIPKNLKYAIRQRVKEIRYERK